MGAGVGSRPGIDLPPRADVVVVGGGPAGAATALAARGRGLEVVLAEAGEYRGFRVGESVPPPVAGALAELGAPSLLRDSGALESFGADAAWGSAEVHHQDYLVGLRGTGWHLDRRRFDAGLAAIAAEAGASAATGARVAAVARANGEWRVALAGRGGATGTVRATLVVDATGRRASIARSLGAKSHGYDGLVAAVVRYRARRETPQRVLVESAHRGWWYAAPVPGGSVVVAFLSDADLVRGDALKKKANWERALARTRHVAPLVAGAELTLGPTLWPAGSCLLDPGHGKGWLAVGDAGAGFDPLSSVGILESLRSGLLAGRALEAYLGGDSAALARVSAERRRDFESYLDERQAVYGREGRFRDGAFWRRRAATIHLDPRARVVLAAGGAGLSRVAGSPLSRVERGLVAELCCESVEARQVAARLAEAGRWTRAHGRLILGLQDLVERGLLTLYSSGGLAPDGP